MSNELFRESEHENENDGDLEIKSQLEKVKQEVTAQEQHEGDPRRELILLQIQGSEYKLHYDKSMLSKDFLRVNCMLSPSETTARNKLASPVSFSIPKDFFATNPVSLNIDFWLSRKLTHGEQEVVDEAILKLRSFYKESFITGDNSSTIEVAVNPQDHQPVPHVEEFIEESETPSAPIETPPSMFDTNENRGSISSREIKYVEGQLNLPSVNWLTVTDGITGKLTINDLIIPDYEVIQIKNRTGQITKAWRNGKSYIALGGERKGLRPYIHNGDSFMNISETHEVVIRAKTPRDLSDKKTVCYIFAGKEYTINDLIAPNQGLVAIDYTNTTNPNGGVHQAVRDTAKGTYIDQYTNKEVLTYDGIQITLGSIVDLGSNIFHNGDTTPSQLSQRERIEVAPLVDREIKKVKSSTTKTESADPIGSISTPFQWEDYAISPSVSRNQFCEALHAIESTNKGGPYGYGAVNKHSNALGRYQFVWSKHKANIKKVTGVKNEQEFLASTQAQEKFMDFRIVSLKKHTDRIRRKEKNANKYTNEELYALCHFLGGGGAEYYVRTGKMLPNQVANNVSAEKYLKVFNSRLAEQKNNHKSGDIAAK